MPLSTGLTFFFSFANPGQELDSENLNKKKMKGVKSQPWGFKSILKSSRITATNGPCQLSGAKSLGYQAMSDGI